MEKTIEKSEEQATIIKLMQELALKLDVDYLENAYEDMKRDHSWRDSAMILNPNPQTHFEKQDLEAVKLKQLRLYIDLSKNTKEIIECEAALINAKLNAEKMSRMFK